MGWLTQAQWDRYTEVLDGFHDDAFQQDITLRRYVTINDQHGEDTNLRERDTILKGLVQYNYFRSWPMNKISDSGEVDKESILLFLNVTYLNSINMATANGQLKFEPALDRFFIDGLQYKSSGDSQAAQAQGKTLFVYIILKREETNTGSEYYLRKT